MTSDTSRIERNERDLKRLEDQLAYVRDRLSCLTSSFDRLSAEFEALIEITKNFAARLPQEK